MEKVYEELARELEVRVAEGGVRESFMLFLFEPDDDQGK